MPVESPEPESQTVRVWDLPTRLFYCSLMLTLIGAVVSGEIGGKAMVWHARLGMVVLAVHGATGVVADDEIATTGPLNRFVSSATAIAASAWHTEVGKIVLIVLVIAHVAAVLYYLWRKRKNLIAPMIHGDMPLPAGTTPSADSADRRVGASVRWCWWRPPQHWPGGSAAWAQHE